MSLRRLFGPAVCFASFLCASWPACGAVTGTIQDVQHVVILMQENRSFDHYFGAMQGVRGYNDPNILVLQNGSSVLFQPAGGTNYVLPYPNTNACIGDVNHGETDGWNAWDNGWWNSWYWFKGSMAMTYNTRTNLPFYYALADAYTVCDNNFCSFMGSTFPNRLYLFSGMVDPTGTGGGPALDNTVPTNGFTWTTYPERLQSAGVSWKVYRTGGDWFGDALPWFAQYKNAKPGNPLYDRGISPVNDVVAALKADVTNNTLPKVSWVIPQTFTVSEHPPYSVDYGEQFVQQVLGALAANPAVFTNTVFILTYDENGGFFDHVLPPVPPAGTTNEFAKGLPLGLGVRVPMIIASPWSRGGRVCSQVFDHTSIIRFLETWTGVQEPNISAWRRQVCGDLTSAFDFAHPDPTVPSLPAFPIRNPPTVWPPVPAVQTVPVQEPGVRPACPLPYQPDASCSTDCNSNRVVITMTNSGAASVHFAIYPNAFRTDNPKQYDAAPGAAVTDAFVAPALAKGGYDFTCYGPNGFQRRFAGNISKDCSQMEVATSMDSNLGVLTLSVVNYGSSQITFTVADNLNNTNWPAAVSPGTVSNIVFSAWANNNGWYDLTVTADADATFLRHLAGHIETGAFSFTEPPAIVGNPLNIPTSTNVPAVVPVNPAPVITISNIVNQFIAQNPLPPVSANPPALAITTYDTNCALIYPGWATNCVVETNPTLSSGGWTQLISPTLTISNYYVVILPETNIGQYFRLRQ